MKKKFTIFVVLLAGIITLAMHKAYNGFINKNRRKKT